MAVRQITHALLKARVSLRPLNSYIHATGVQNLFASDLLGLDSFQRQQAVLRQKVGDLQDEFRERMNTYLESEDNTVFTGDLKSMLYSASNDDDLETIEKMLSRFRKQRSEIRFSDFVFGPLVMRMLHLLNKPELALQLFMQGPDSDGFYDQLSTFSVLMDLLFENELYDDVIQVMMSVIDKQVAGFKYPADCFVIFAAACCKKNTSDAYELLLHHLTQATKDEKKLSMRTYTYATHLALKKNDPSTAQEILDGRVFPSGKVPVIHTNLKVRMLMQIGRLEDAMFELQCLLNNDGPESKIHDVFNEVVEDLRTAVDKEGNTVLSHKMNELYRSLEENHHLNPQSLEEYMYSPIIRKRQAQDGYRNRRRSGAMGYSRTQNRGVRGLRLEEDFA